MSGKRSFNGYWLVAAIALVSGAFLLYLFIAGRVQGEEFSPDDFSRRSFSYNVMPIFRINLRGIQYQDSTPVFEQTLYADGLIGTANPDKQWDLVRDSVSDLRSSDFDARFLCKFLDLTGPDSESIWFQWNRNHPKLATRFWPIIADLARENMYLNIPEIMFQAIGVSDANEDSFCDFLQNSASTAFLEKAIQLHDQRKFEAAIALYTQSILILPSKQALSGRASCYRELGKSELAEQDLQDPENL